MELLSLFINGNELRAYFNWIQLLYQLWTTLIVKILKKKLPLIMSSPSPLHSGCLFLQSTVLLIVIRLSLFHFLWLVSNCFTVYQTASHLIFFVTFFIEMFRIRPIFFTVTLCFLEMLAVHFLPQLDLHVLSPSYCNRFIASCAVYFGTSSILMNSHCFMTSGCIVIISFFLIDHYHKT